MNRPWLRHLRLAGTPRRIGAWLWSEKGLVALLGFMGASIAPMTTYISSRAALEVEREKSAATLRMQLQKQRHEIRLSYLDKIVALPPDAAVRSEILHFLAANNEDPDLSGWARELLSKEPIVANAPCDLERQRCASSCTQTFEDDRSGDSAELRRQRVVHLSDCLDACTDTSLRCSLPAHTKADPHGGVYTPPTIKDVEQFQNTCTYFELVVYPKSLSEDERREAERRAMVRCAKRFIRSAYDAGAAERSRMRLRSPAPSASSSTP